MKASEVLTNYAAGETDFKGISLRGQSFERQNLSGADFSEADLRGTKFIGVDLRGTNFTGAKCGLQKRWAAFLLIVSWLLALISGAGSLLVSSFVLLIFDASLLRNQIVGWVSLVVIVCFLILFIFKGIRIGGLFGMAIVAIAFTGTISAILIKVISTIVSATISVGLAGTVSVAVISVGAIAGAVSEAALGTGAILIAAIISISLTIIGSSEVANAGAISAALSLAFASSVSITGIFIGWRAMKGDKKDAWINSFAIAFAAFNGTSFRGADLTDANFSSARLKSTDMRQATLTRVRWYGTDMTDRVRPGDTYLQSTQIRQWLIGQGVNKNFDGQKLQGINFEGADLTDASFIDANLNEANLQDADLSRAKLVQTQLDETDFTGATLTGAFIEDWGITSNTKLDGVRCEYVFMRLPTYKDPDPYRKPDNRSEVFEDSDFADFIKPIFDTLDLYHNQGVDPRAIAISWKKLAENNPDAQLEFASMEVKGENNLLLRLKTEVNADLSQLSAEYFETYNQIKVLTAEEYKYLGKINCIFCSKVFENIFDILN